MAGKELFIEKIEGKNEGWRKKFKSKRFKKIFSIKKSKFGAFSALSLSLLTKKKPFDLQMNELKRKKNFIEAFFFSGLANVTTLTLKICIGNSTL